MPDKFKNRYRIASSRLRNWDYSSKGAYFITICTRQRRHYFGQIINCEMQLSPVGQHAYECWLAIPDHFPHFYLDAFQIMPDHVHGILVIEKPFVNKGFDAPETGHVAAETGHVLSLLPQGNVDKQAAKQHFRFRNQGKNTISAAVGSSKAVVTKYCNENQFAFGWQTRFHDHIIRNAEELHSIRNYIINNPRNWKHDGF